VALLEIKTVNRFDSLFEAWGITQILLPTS
jgi:hypothetical protein